MSFDHCMPALAFGDLTARVPVVQGGMGVGISMSSLAAAVAEAGGVGVISSAGVGFDMPGYRETPEETSCLALRAEILKARAQTRGVLGVNIMVAQANYAGMVRTSVEAGADIIFSGAGLPLDLPEYRTEACHTRLVPIVSSARAATLILRRWLSRYNYLPDAFVVEGPKAGGHLGFSREQLEDTSLTLESITADLLRTLAPYEAQYGRKIPVISGGGIFTGEDIARLLAMGASGVQMGTRFVATHECDASDAFKQAILDCREEDITIIDSPVGLPGRAIRNDFIRAAEAGTKHPFACPYHCIKSCKISESPYCIAQALMNAKKGLVRSGFAFAGTNAPRVNEIVSVRDLMSSLQHEYHATRLALV